MVPGVEAGVFEQAVLASLPAAATTTTPSFMRAVIAASTCAT